MCLGDLYCSGALHRRFGDLLAYVPGGADPHSSTATPEAEDGLVDPGRDPARSLSPPRSAHGWPAQLSRRTQVVCEPALRTVLRHLAADFAVVGCFEPWAASNLSKPMDRFILLTDLWSLGKSNPRHQPCKGESWCTTAHYRPADLLEHPTMGNKSYL